MGLIVIMQSLPLFDPSWFGLQANNAVSQMWQIIQNIFSAYQPLFVFIIGVSLCMTLLKMVTRK